MLAYLGVSSNCIDNSEESPGSDSLRSLLFFAFTCSLRSLRSVSGSGPASDSFVEFLAVLILSKVPFLGCVTAGLGLLEVICSGWLTGVDLLGIFCSDTSCKLIEDPSRTLLASRFFRS